MATIDKLHLDFETYSEVDLKAVGAWAYSKHPSTEVLMAAWAYDNDTPEIWLPGETKEPSWANVIYKYKAPAFQITAWNDFFELCIMANVLKWYIPPPQKWADTAAKAAALALPRSLDACGAALGLGIEHVKDKEGKNLIQIFSKPKVSTKKATRGELIRTLPSDEPELFKKFQRYCIKDVIAERMIDRLLPELQDRTRKLWELDREINLRGVRFDMPSVKNAIATISIAREKAVKKVSDVTDGLLDNISSRDQFLEYMGYMGVPLENAQKDYLKRIVKQLDDDIAEAAHVDQKRGGELQEAKDIIKLRLEVSRSSLAKYDKLISIVDESNRAYGLLRFHGASTGRWSGNLFQPQNLPKKSLDLPDLCIELLESRDPKSIELLFGTCLRAISLCLRGMITASPGNRLVVSDFSQIESRVLAWLAGDLAKLEAYEKGLDIYKLTASNALKIDYDKITKELRSVGKVMDLFCGYGGGWKVYQKEAAKAGFDVFDDEAKKYVNDWRKSNHKITSYWNNIEATAVKAVAEPGTIQKLRNVGYRMMGSGNRSFLFCILPSGRRIAYHKPRLVEGKYDRMQIVYMGVDSVTKKYCRQRTYGGNLVANITQATAADCIYDKMIDIDAAGYPIVLTVHDEPVSDTPKGHGSLEEFNQIMETVPKWAAGLPVAADGYEAHRYKK